MEPWWNRNGGKNYITAANLSRGHFVNQTSHTDWSGNEHGTDW